MVAVNGAWSRDQLRQFLGEAQVPMRLACHHTGGGLWMLSLWYEHEEGVFRCATGADSDVAGFLARNDGVAFEVSTNRPPYMGVRGNGTATLESDEDKETLRALVDRYLGGTDSDLARKLLADDREELRIMVEPDRLYTWDFTDRMRDAGASGQTGGSLSPKYDL